MHMWIIGLNQRTNLEGGVILEGVWARNNQHLEYR